MAGGNEGRRGNEMRFRLGTQAINRGFMRLRNMVTTRAYRVPMKVQPACSLLLISPTWPLVLWKRQTMQPSLACDEGTEG